MARPLPRAPCPEFTPSGIVSRGVANSRARQVPAAAGSSMQDRRPGTNLGQSQSLIHDWDCHESLPKVGRLASIELPPPAGTWRALELVHLHLSPRSAPDLPTLLKVASKQGLRKVRRLVSLQPFEPTHNNTCCQAFRSSSTLLAFTS